MGVLEGFALAGLVVEHERIRIAARSRNLLPPEFWPERTR